MQVLTAFRERIQGKRGNLGFTAALETGIWTAISILGDDYARRHPLELLRSMARLRKSPFTRSGPVKQLFGYHRWGFHPNDRETAEMISTWREKLFGREGTLVQLLAG